MTANRMSPGEFHLALESRLARARRSAVASRPRAKRRPAFHRRAASAVLAAGILLIGAVAGTFAADDYINLTINDAIVTYDGAVYAQGGVGAGTGNFDPFLTLDPSQIPHSDPAAQAAQEGTAEGYNQCDDTGCPDERGDPPYYFDQFFGGGRTHEIKVSAIPTLEYLGSKYREFSLDANDEGNDTWMSVDEIKIFTDTQANLTGYSNLTESFSADTGPGAVKIFDMDDGAGGDMSILMVSQGLESGSGVSDITVLVPDSLFPAGCEYGSTICDKFLYFWSSMGYLEDGNHAGVTCTQNPCDWDVSAGFEEWRIRFLPVVNVEKTAEVSFTRDYSWSVEKTVDPTSLDLFDGDSADVTWSVTPTRDGFEDTDFVVSGTITIFNPTGADPIPEDIDAEILSVEDVLTLDSTDFNLDPSDIDCGVTFPYTLEPQDSLVCNYEYSPDPADVDGSSSGENVATVTIESGIPAVTGGISFSQQVEYQGTASVDFGSATPTEVDATATLTDDRGPLNQAAVSGQTEDYEENFACGADEGTHDNTARVTEDDSGDFDEDSASITVNCYDLSVSKTADESKTRTYNWTIDKSVDPATWDLFTGDTGTSEYTVTVTKTGFTDSDWHVEGDITIHNNHPSLAADLTEVTDAISGFGDATVNCPSLTVPADGELVCTYEADLPDGDTRTNTATATQQNYDYDADGIATAGGTTDYDGTASVDFSGAPTNEVNATINVDDTYQGDLGSFSDSGFTTYERTFACDDDEGTKDNTATIVETDQSDDASVEVTCYQLSVSKDADESFTRTYEWEIDKSADQDALTLMPGETFPVNYSVTVDVTGSTDSDFHVEGDITIGNAHPTLDADLTDVTDEIFDSIAASVNCPSMIVPADGELVCSYSSDLSDASTRLNTATATQQNYDYDKDLVATASGTTDYEGTTNVVFGDPTELVDECVDVNDTLAGFLGTVCVDDVPPPPTEFSYPVDFGPFTEADCGEFDVPNTADFLTNDTAATGDDSWNVHVTIPCPEGCTLTQGYWKTHNEEFWGGAPEDPNWYLIGDIDGDTDSEGPNEDFFDTGMTWFEVFWTNPAGRPYYQLAHQWMAAYLNKLSIEAIGGSIPADVQTALTEGAALLDEYDGSEPGKSPDIKGKAAKSIRADFVHWAGILGDFNEGTIGPGHCDEPIVVTDSQNLSGLVFALPLGLLIPFAVWLRRRAR